METLRIQPEAPQMSSRLLKTRDQQEEGGGEGEEGEGEEGQEENQIGRVDYERLDVLVRSLETFFCFFGFYRTSRLHRSVVSWSVLLILGFLVPVIVLYYYSSSKTEVTRIVELEVGIPALQMVLALATVICVSHNLRKYSVRRFLFVDKRYEELDRLHQQYAEKIKVFYKVIFFWMLPCLAMKTAVGITYIYSTCHERCSLPIVILIASIVSWTYLTTIFLAGCSLFCLICNLQVVQFDDYREFLMTGKDVSVLLNEHMRLCYYLSKISHRFRLQLTLVFFISIASQFIALLRTTQYAGLVNFINVGDLFPTLNYKWKMKMNHPSKSGSLQASSAVQVIGIVSCLIAATRISHRAQSVASVASRWHALATCEDSEDFQAIQSRNTKAVLAKESLFHHSGVKPLETRIQTSHSQRQALVMYLQSNNGGITIYGWAVDRGLITTIVCIELSLLLFIFSGF